MMAQKQSKSDVALGHYPGDVDPLRVLRSVKAHQKRVADLAADLTSAAFSREVLYTAIAAHLTKNRPTLESKIQKNVIKQLGCRIGDVAIHFPTLPVIINRAQAKAFLTGRIDRAVVAVMTTLFHGGSKATMFRQKSSEWRIIAMIMKLLGMAGGGGIKTELVRKWMHDDLTAETKADIKVLLQDVKFSAPIVNNSSNMGASANVVAAETQLETALAPIDPSVKEWFVKALKYMSTAVLADLEFSPTVSAPLQCMLLSLFLDFWRTWTDMSDLNVGLQFIFSPPGTLYDPNWMVDEDLETVGELKVHGPTVRYYNLFPVTPVLCGKRIEDVVSPTHLKGSNVYVEVQVIAETVGTPEVIEEDEQVSWILV
ncbi:hypothetical protein BC828DRAFT_394052 [Blastocladiella britannica]|nr:hypothetical protein BC828DRAFT_394052 [Blastocladiella britannica]